MHEKPFSLCRRKKREEKARKISSKRERRSFSCCLRGRKEKKVYRWCFHRMQIISIAIAISSDPFPLVMKKNIKKDLFSLLPNHGHRSACVCVSVDGKSNGNKLKR
jgi:hypothetical protein